MEKAPSFGSFEKRFASPEEELAYLRAQVAERERQIRESSASEWKRGASAEAAIQAAAAESIEAYKQVAPERALHKDVLLSAAEQGAIVLNLAPEAHDAKMSELLGIMQEHGIKNVLEIVAKLDNPHVTDDLDRFLVQYLKAGYPVTGLKEKEPLARALRMTLYEISLPEPSEEERGREKQLKELLSSMEQFYAGMLSVGAGRDSDGQDAHYFTMELAVSNHSDEFVFYAGVPDSKTSLFEKQILSVFHNARIEKHSDDYNIFNEKGATAGSVLSLDKNPIFPIKTYDQFDYDPLNIILNSFSKIVRDGEGGAIQVVFKPTDDHYLRNYKRALDQIQGGAKVKDAIDIPETFFDHLRVAFKAPADSSKKKTEEAKGRLDQGADQIAVDAIKAKIATPIVTANVRLVASAEDASRADQILSEIESSFNQFENTQGNRFSFDRLKGRALSSMLKDFSFRLFSDGDRMPLSLREVATFMHLPATVIKTAPQLKTSRAGSAPAPLDIPQTGILLGVNSHRNVDTKVYMQPEDRLRHFYVIGQTGTGKTTFLKNMIIQDIRNGEGVCMIDPHGSDIQDVLAQIPPERYEDVIYFDPSYAPRPMGLNMLEYDPRFPEQKTFVVNELFSIFQKLYGAVPESMGPMFEQYFRNATMLVIEDPESGCTLLDVSRVMSNKQFRELKLSRCQNPVVVQFWKEIAEKAGGEASLANIVPYITSKFDVFLANEIMRPIVSQERSSFNFREIMDGKKILLVNLAKGRLGDINANLIGLIIVGKILMAALSRVDAVGTGKALPPFYLYIDEFQNVTTPSISTILSEARKYKLALVVAHQFIAQLDEKIRDSVFGNVGSMAVFRVGSADAEVFEKQLSPVFTEKDIMNIDNYNAYLRPLIGGRPAKPFNIRVMPPEKAPEGDHSPLEKLKELSYLKFGRERADVEAEIMKKYQKAPPAEPELDARRARF